MNFYRKVTYEDLDFKMRDYNNFLSQEVRDKIEAGGYSPLSKIREENHCSIQEAKAISDKYAEFLRVKEDFRNGVEIFTDY